MDTNSIVVSYDTTYVIFPEIAEENERHKRIMLACGYLNLNKVLSDEENRSNSGVAE
jgi:hypothetical protein